MTLAEWKNKVVEVQGFDGLGEPFMSPSGKLCFKWGGYTYGCMGSREDPFITPPNTFWVGIDRDKVTKYTGPPIDWDQEISEE